MHVTGRMGLFILVLQAAAPVGGGIWIEDGVGELRYIKKLGTALPRIQGCDK